MFIYHQTEDNQKETNMEKLWLENRKQKIIEKQELINVNNKIYNWGSKMARLEEESNRKYEQSTIL